MSIIPVTVPTGAIRYNTDSNKMECFNGTKWYEIAVSSPDLDGGARGVIAGGYPASNVIQYITIPTTGNAIDFGDLSHATALSGGCASNTRGLITGDYPSTGDDIDYITIASTGNGTDFGNMTVSVYNGRAFSNQTRGLHCGGHTPTGQNVIGYVTIATTGNALDFGDISYGAVWGPSTCASPTRGFMYGGYDGSSYYNNIEYVTISTTGNSQDFGDLTHLETNASGCSNSTRGVNFGGSQGTNDSVIDYFNLASAGNAVNFGDLTVGRYTSGAMASSIRGVCAGGRSDSPSPNTQSDVIDYITFATQGDAVDFGNLLSGAKSTTAGLSNAHGGL